MAAESKNSFFDSLVKIGQGFQDIFGIFGNAIGDALGFNAVKSGDKRSKVGEHFKKIGDGLTTTKDKLKELSGEISEAKNANGSSIEVVKGVIRGAGDVFDKLIGALTKLVDVAKEAGSTDIGDTASAAAAVAADKDGVEAIIAGIKAIIDVADKSGVKIEKGNAGGPVNAAATTDASAVLGGANGNAAANAGDKLAAEVAKADPWAMIDKIKNAKATAPAALAGNNNNHEAGALDASNANAAAASAPAAIGSNNAGQGAGDKLAAEVAKADPWAMINKIKNAKTGINLAVGDNNEVGALATKIADANSTGAKTNADLAAAVALKAITKGGKFTQPAANEAGAVKAAAASAVNKVLGILDVIIRKAVNLELGKIKEAVKGIKYSEITGEATESDTAQPITNKSSN